MLFSLVLSLLFALGYPRVLFLSCFMLFLPPFGLHSFDLGLGLGGRAAGTGLCRPKGLRSVLGHMSVHTDLDYGAVQERKSDSVFFGHFV